MRLEDTHTPAGYFIAIVAVLGGAMLMPPFPVFIVVIAPALLLSILAFSLFRARRRRIQAAKVSQVMNTVTVYPPVSVTPSAPVLTEEVSSKRIERETITV